MTDLSADLKAAIATIVAAENQLPEEYRATFRQALTDLARLAEQEIDGAIKAEAAHVPLFGSLIANAVTSAVNKSIETGVTQIEPQA